jgi:hypothetical protein
MSGHHTRQASKSTAEIFNFAVLRCVQMGKLPQAFSGFWEVYGENTVNSFTGLTQ